jgi:hypothetical protein
MTDFEEQKRNLANDWGELAPRSDYRIGDLLRYRLHILCCEHRQGVTQIATK